MIAISERELVEGLIAGLTAERAALRSRIAQLEATPKKLVVNLNDRVRFRILRGQSKLFDDPEITVEERCGDGSVVANAQLHALFAIVGPVLRPWLQPPIDCNVEVILEPKA